jgi:hypothetical protein
MYKQNSSSSVINVQIVQSWRPLADVLNIADNDIVFFSSLFSFLSTEEEKL